MEDSQILNILDNFSEMNSQTTPILADDLGRDCYLKKKSDLDSTFSNIYLSVLSNLSLEKEVQISFEEISPCNSTIKINDISHPNETDEATCENINRGINASTDSTNSLDINQINEEFFNFLNKHCTVFVWALKHSDFEDGIENAPIVEIKNYITKNKFVTYSWLHTIYSNCQKDSDIISALLRIIAMTVEDKDYDKLLPIVKAGLSDKSSKAQEAAIMVIEQWRSKNCLDAIRTAEFQSQWIKEYAKKVEFELIKELEKC